MSQYEDAVVNYFKAIEAMNDAINVPAVEARTEKARLQCQSAQEEVNRHRAWHGC